MRINIVKSKNAEQLYIIKSFRKDGKSTTKIMKKLGTMTSLLPLHNNNREEVIAWAKEEARIMTEAENNEALDISMHLSEAKQIKMDEKVLFNGGYLFLQDIFYELGLDKICSSISAKHKFEYNLTDILSRLIYGRVINPASKLSTFEFSKNLIEQPKHELHQIYRALDVIAEESDFIQSEAYSRSADVSKRNTSVLYYDCTNYFFEIEEESGLRQYGKSKEHRPNPIVQMGLFLDGDGIPLAFNIFPGNQNEQPTLIPLEKQIINDFGLSKFVICTDAGLASDANRRFNNINNRSFVVTQPIKKLKKHLKEWSLSPKSWHLFGSDRIFNLNEIDEEKYCKSIFYKERWINENGFEQRLIVTYSPKYKNYQRYIRERQIDRAIKIISNGKSSKTRNMNSPTRFINETSVTEDGEIASQLSISLDNEKIHQEEIYDGFSAVCTTLEDNAIEIVKINKRRWEIEAAFRIMKSEFKSRPAYVRKDDRIKAHFLTCFLSLLVLRNLEKKLDDEFTTSEVLETLKNHLFLKFDGIGYMPAYQRTALTDRLHEIFGFRTDSEIITDKKMKKIIKGTKN